MSSLNGRTTQRLASIIDAADHSAHDSVALRGLIPRYFAEVSADELGERGGVAWVEVAAAHLAVGQRRAPGETLVRLSPAPNGRALTVVTDDAPYLVDTTRLVLERFGIRSRLMIHPIVNVARDAEGRFIEVNLAAPAEAWTYLETEFVDAVDDDALLAAVRAAIANVHLVVDDAPAIIAVATALATNLEADPAAGHSASESDEVAKLLNWLTRKHFVFLGAASYRLVDGGLVVEDGSQLGMLRYSDVVDPVFAPTDFLVSIVRSDAEVELARRARPACLAVRSFDADGKVIGETRFFGLFSEAAYRAPAVSIPLIRERIAWVEGRSKLDPSSHLGRTQRMVLETFPRDELFEIRREELAEVSAEIVALQHRDVVRVLELRSPESGWQTLAVYLPRLRLAPETPQRVAEAISASTGASDVAFDVFTSSNPLSRITVEVRRPEMITDDELSRLGREVDVLTQRWGDRLREALVARCGDAEGAALASRYALLNDQHYTTLTTPEEAACDIAVIESMEHTVAALTGKGLGGGAEVGALRFRIYRREAPLALSDVLPLLDQLGLRAIDERPFSLTTPDGPLWLYDIGVEMVAASAAQPGVRADLEHSFLGLLTGELESDGLNRLVLAAGLNARQVAVLRAYVKYLRQIGFHFSQPYIEETLVKHAQVSSDLIELFAARFDVERADEGRDTLVAAIRQRIEASLAAIVSLDEDRIGRALMQLVLATVRTNAYQVGADGSARRPVLAFKLDPAHVPDLPEPRPMFEIWVASPRVEGVHLRGGRIARGGLRWSDRREDFRTEVLGLMKAQMVKNSVIVPVGAKGGFVLKRPPSDPDALRREVAECYAEFVAGLLDVTDNIVDGVTVAPARTIRYDGDDPYLVVAADKGTATFSDLANSISQRYSFWLGDAFASGGSVGYDHKAMAITARGAWESVRRHAQVLGKNADSDPLTAVGVGDMSGDVFGNGMLRSPHAAIGRRLRPSAHLSRPQSRCRSSVP